MSLECNNDCFQASDLEKTLFFQTKTLNSVAISVVFPLPPVRIFPQWIYSTSLMLPFLFFQQCHRDILGPILFLAAPYYVSFVFNCFFYEFLVVQNTMRRVPGILSQESFAAPEQVNTGQELTYYCCLMWALVISCMCAACTASVSWTNLSVTCVRYDMWECMRVQTSMLCVLGSL